MKPELEELIQKRAHEIWEQEGRPHGRDEEHWSLAAEEITLEIERIKANHKPEPDPESETEQVPPKGRPRRTKITEDTPTPRTRKAGKATTTVSVASADNAGLGPSEEAPLRSRGRKATGEVQAEATASPARTTRRRTPKAAEGA